MKYVIQSSDGQKFESDSLEAISHALAQGTVPKDAWAWHEGLPEWVPVVQLFDAKPGNVEKAKAAAGFAKGLLGKAGSGLAGFAAKQYKKATLTTRFSKALASMLDDGQLSSEELDALKQMVHGAGADWSSTVAECRPIAVQFVRHQLADAIEDGEITPNEEEQIQRSMKVFGLGDMVTEVAATIRRVKLLSQIRQKKLPPPLTERPIWLASGEAAYFKSQAELRKNDRIVALGDIWITPSRLEYVSPQKGASIPLKRIRAVRGRGNFLIVNDVKSARDFRTNDAEVAAALLNCLIQAGNRTIGLNEDESLKDRRRISKEVRNAVWIRDGACCVECGASDYLEFDHVIPVSKGGGNTVENIQVLCRGCNGRKSSRI